MDALDGALLDRVVDRLFQCFVLFEDDRLLAVFVESKYVGAKVDTQAATDTFVGFDEYLLAHDAPFFEVDR